MSTRQSLCRAFLALVVVGCAAQGPYRMGKDATEYVVADRSLCPDLPAPSSHRTPVAYVEIDEQGYFQDRDQIERALALVGEDGRSKYVVVFVHGWFHSARQTDDNVRRFKCALNDLQGIDANAGGSVIGIYIGWRGESLEVPLLRYLTFWDRKNTSDEIGRGSLVEFLTRLERTVKPTPASRNKLMLVGHSFGASVVFNSVGQILLQRFLLDAEKLASAGPAPTHSQSRPGLVSGYGDLVVLVNPAIEATRLIPFFSSLSDYTTRRADLLSASQPARLVILSSAGDNATRIAFPAARAVSTMLESYQDLRIRTPYGGTVQVSERFLDWQTMGNVARLHTHAPLRQLGQRRWDGRCPSVDREWLRKAIEKRKEEQRRNREAETGTGWTKVFEGTGIQLTHHGVTTPSNPLWVMAVGTELIPDHSSIANPALICFFDELLGDLEVVSREGQNHLRFLREKR